MSRAPLPAPRWLNAHRWQCDRGHVSGAAGTPPPPSCYRCRTPCPPSRPPPEAASALARAGFKLAGDA